MQRRQSSLDTCFFYTPSEVCRSCIFPIFLAFDHCWWQLTLLLVKNRFFRISPCLAMCKMNFKMQNRQWYGVFSQCLRKFSFRWLIIGLKPQHFTPQTSNLKPQTSNLKLQVYKFINDAWQTQWSQKRCWKAVLPVCSLHESYFYTEGGYNAILKTNYFLFFFFLCFYKQGASNRCKTS